LVVDVSRTRRLVVEISYFEKYRYAQLQNRELKTELIRVRIGTHLFFDSICYRYCPFNGSDAQENKTCILGEEHQLDEFCVNKVLHP